MDKVIRSVYVNDLSGNDVSYITRGKAKIVLYKDLLNASSILDIIGKTNQCILLFPTEMDDNNGHWVAILYHPKTNTIEHSDSYGLDASQEIGYSSNPYVKEKLLNKLYMQAQNNGYKVVYNTYRFQKLKTGYNQCGRFASLRCRFHYLDVNQYAKLLMGQNESPDWLVTCLTFITLKEDEKEEQDIIQIFSK
jgi:hypothetical protein